MSSGGWIKLWLDILDDDKIFEMPGDIFKIFIYILLVAKESNQGDILPSVKKLAWRLRLSNSEIENAINYLKQDGIDIIGEENGTYRIINFLKRQAVPSSVERVRKHREKQKETEEDVTKCNALRNALHDSPLPLLSSDSLSLTQTGDSIISRVFSKVTGMTAIPGSELSKVVPAMDALHNKFSSEEDFINYLKPFYEWWKKQKRKDNVPYSKTNCSWIYDIAISGEIPEKVKEKPKKEIMVDDDGGMYL
jgi:DNA-binding transcriptional regulator YhcF (GntR family)